MNLQTVRTVCEELGVPEIRARIQQQRDAVADMDADADGEDEDEDEDEEDKAAERRVTVMMEAAKLNAIAVDYLKKVLEFTKRIQALCEK